jgi:cytochrome c biogenesis protein CcdA
LNKIDISKHYSESFSAKINSFKYNALTRFSRYNYVTSSFLFGLVISIALGPCSLSIVLPAILLTIFNAPSPLQGGVLLSTFGLGHSLPVIFLSTLLASARKIISEKTATSGKWVANISGVTFIIIGISLIIYTLGG